MIIMITGGSGLVGRNISERLRDEGHEVLAPSHAELNLLSYDDVFRYMTSKNPEMVIHCAGKVGGIQANIREPVRFLIDNIDMGRNVIMAAFEAGIGKLLNFGSSCMYPRNADNPLKEEYILQGELEPTNEGYALAKITAQRLCSYIMKENKDYSYKTLMPCNLYGKYDKFDLAHAHMIPAAINKVHAAKMDRSIVTVWGTGKVKREFMYVGDLSDCVSHCIRNFKSMPEVLNAGIGRDFSINDYYRTVADVIGYKGEFVHDTTKPEGMKQKLVDTTLLNSFGWKSNVSLLQGIEETYKYYLTTIKG